jgi:uncharacterized protein
MNLLYKKSFINSKHNTYIELANINIMELQLKGKPKKPIIIEGFPGFGFVGTIATEFLIEHLNAKPIGRIHSHEILPIAAIHHSSIVEPLGIFYSKKHNIMIVHALTSIQGLEWKISEMLKNLCKTLNARELISLEGVGSQTGSKESNVYFYSSVEKLRSRMEKLNMKPLKEGVVMGVTGSLLLRNKVPLTAFFVETTTGLPDSRGAAKLIETLDKYLKLNVDYKPLLKKAEEFEGKLKGLMKQSQDASKMKDKKELSYFG